MSQTNSTKNISPPLSLPVPCLSFSINIPIIFQYFACIISTFQYNNIFITKDSIYDVCTKFSQFSVFLKFYQYLRSEFSKNTDKSVYLEALPSLPSSFITKKRRLKVY